MASSGFVVSEAIETLTYNFAPYGTEGVIPEPSAMLIRDFRKAISGIMAEELREDEKAEKPEEGSVSWAKQVIEVLGRDSTAVTGKLMHAVAAVCSDSPSVDELQKLPYRAQQAFVGWVTGIFLLPSAQTPATKS